MTIYMFTIYTIDRKYKHMFNLRDQRFIETNLFKKCLYNIKITSQEMETFIFWMYRKKSLCVIASEKKIILFSLITSSVEFFL